MLQNAAFMPHAQLQNMMNQGLAGANLKQGADIAGANLMAQLGLGGIQTGLNADVARANLIGNMFNSAAGAAGGNNFDPLGDALGGLWDKILGS